MNASSLLRQARRLARISQRELARRAGVSPASVSEIEAGKRDPTVGTMNRLLWATDHGLQVAGMRWTAAGIASEIRTVLGMRDGEGDPDTALRLLFEFLDDLRAVDGEELACMVAERPIGTGQTRFDAFLAALVEHACAAVKYPCPRWTSEPDRFAEPWWFVATLHAPALSDNPISFTRHGVIIGTHGLSRA